MRLSLLLLLVFHAGGVAAQSRACWRGRPLSHCDSFWITDFLYGTRLNSAGGDYFAWEFGQMVNEGPHHAFGGALVKSLGEERSYFGMRPRYRRWLDDETSLDLSVGILVSGDHDRFKPRFPSFTAHVALSRSDILGAIVGAEVLRRGCGGAEVTWQVGVRFGSYAGPPAGILIMLKMLIAELSEGGT